MDGMMYSVLYRRTGAWWSNVRIDTYLVNRANLYTLCCVSEHCLREHCVGEYCVSEHCVNEHCVSELCVSEQCVSEHYNCKCK